MRPACPDLSGSRPQVASAFRPTPFGYALCPFFQSSIGNSHPLAPSAHPPAPALSTFDRTSWHRVKASFRMQPNRLQRHPFKRWRDVWFLLSSSRWGSWKGPVYSSRVDAHMKFWPEVRRPARVRRRLGRRAGSLVALFLVLLQFHLLWVVVLHRHAGTGSPSRTSSIHQPNSQNTPAADTGLLCAACQIVRHGAVRPALSPVTLSPVAATILGAVVPASHFTSFQPGAVYGRAPPLG